MDIAIKGNANSPNGLEWISNNGKTVRRTDKECNSSRRRQGARMGSKRRQGYLEATVAARSRANVRTDCSQSALNFLPNLALTFLFSGLELVIGPT